MLHHLLLGAALAVGQADTPPPKPGEKPAEEAYFEEEKPVPETVAEEEIEAATPDRFLLMRALQGTWLGVAMDTSRVSCFGWAAASFTPSSARHNNTPVVWNDLANDFLLQQAWVRLERSVVTSGTSEPSWGFRVDWLYGSDYRFTLERGLFDYQLTENDGRPGLYGYDLIAFYLEGYVPTICNGLDVKVGRWFTPFGMEGLEAISSPLASKSYSFNFAPPFTHTGALFTLNINPAWTLQMGPCIGNDDFFDAPTNEPRMVSTLRWAPPEGRDTVTFGTSIGHGTFLLEESFNRFNVFDLVWTHAFSSTFSYALECIYGYQGQFPVFNDNGDVDDFVFTNWCGWANYAFWTLTPQVTSVTRLEFFDDAQGVRTGFEGLYTAITTGLQYRPCKSVLVLPELRYDYNGDSRPFEDKHGIFTAGCELLIRW